MTSVSPLAFTSPVSFAFQKGLKTLAAIAMYLVAIFLTYTLEATCIETTNGNIQNFDKVWIWAVFILSMTGLWTLAFWVILSLKLQKNGTDEILPAVFTAVYAVGALTLLACVIAMWWKTHPSALTTIAGCIVVAFFVLRFFIYHAIKNWRGMPNTPVNLF